MTRTLWYVENANYFTAGHGLVAGDMIQLEGHTSAVAIAAIDYESDLITLSRPITWEQGAGVALPFFGQAPDQGAYEHVPQQ